MNSWLLNSFSIIMSRIFVSKYFIHYVMKATSISNISSNRPKPLYSLRRQFYEIFITPKTCFSTNLQLNSVNEYKVTFIKANGDPITAKGKEGDTLLDVVVNNNLDFDGFGACEGTLTCSTCHCIFKQEDYDRLPEKPCDEELDMLDLAYDLTPTSRLGCQIQLSKELDGVEVRIPATVNDARS